MAELCNKCKYRFLSNMSHVQLLMIAMMNVPRRIKERHKK